MPATVIAAPKPANGLTCGIDWARDDHAVSVVDARGREVHRSTVEHSAAGLRELVTVLTRAGVERSGHRAPRRAGRRGAAGRGDHRGGDQPQPAEEPAEPLRLGGQQGRPVRRLRAGRHAAHRPRPAAPAGPRQPCHRRAAREPAGPARTSSPIGSRMANQLRAHLQARLPRCASACSPRLDSPISLAFLTRFDCQDRADWLTPKRLGAWLASVGYCGRTTRPCCTPG